MTNTNSSAKVAVLVLNWNGLSLLKEFMPLWVKYVPSEGGDLIIVDNGSTDGSLAYLKAEYPSVRLIAHAENLGFAEGYNRAILQLEDYEYVLLLNSDAYLDRGWYRPMINLLETEGRNVVAVQPKVRAYRKPQYFEYAGAAGGYLDALGYPYCKGRIFDTIEPDMGQYDEVAYDLAWASGAALLVRRADYLAVGGLDPSFFAHQEEIDLCLRLKRRGGQIAYAPEAIAYHIGGASLEQGSPRKVYLNFRNNLLMLSKNLSLGRLIMILLFRLPLDLIAALRFALWGSFGSAASVVRAWGSFLWRIKQCRDMRRGEERATKPDSHSPLLSRVSVLYHYYVRGHKVYKQIPHN